MTTQALKANAIGYLTQVYGKLPKQPKPLFNFLVDNRWPIHNREDLVEYVSAVLAVVILHEDSAAFCEAAIAHRQTDPRQIEHRKKDRSVDLARMLVDALLNDDGFKAAKQSKLSAWAAAVRYLRQAKILPSRVRSHADQPGEGVDAWSKRGAKRQSKNGAAATPTAAKVVITIGRDRHMWTVSDSLRLKGVRAQLNRLEKEFPVSN